MAIESGGRFTFSDTDLYQGIRQDVSESVLRYRLLQNVALSTRGSLTKDKGLRRLYSTAPYGTSYDTKAGLDARFNDGSQKVLLFLDNGTNVKANLFNADRTLTEQSPAFARVRPWVGMFNNKVIVCDGTTLRSMTAAGAWATPGTAAVNTSTFAVVYANRLVLFGNSSQPFTFYPSEPRDETTWNPDVSVNVTGTQGERITGAQVCGPFLLVGGETFLRAYYLGTASPYDWDWDTISHAIGPVNFQSFITIARTKGSEASNFSFFWSKEGPMMVVQQAQGLPSLFPLWDPLRRMVRGDAYQGAFGLDVSKNSLVEAAWVPEYNEVRFCVTESGHTTPRTLLCVDVDSAIAFALGESSHPFWRVRNNGNFTFPVSTLFTLEVAASGLPSTSGTVRCFCGKDGLFYEMDALTSCKDDGSYVIPLRVIRDGYDGAEEGIQEHVKSARGMHLRATQVGSYTLYARAKGDHGTTSTASFDLSNAVSLWTSDVSLGRWGDGGLWNSGEFVTDRDGLGVLGQKLEVELYDNGEILAPVEINSWSLHGYVEDRR